MVVNVHFEPELTLRSLRGRLRLITPHWPHYPDAIGVIMGDFMIFEPEEGRFNVWKSALFRVFFLAFSKLPSLTIQGETLQSMVFYARCPGLIQRLSIFPWLKHATSIATPMFLRTWRNGPYRDHAAVRVVTQKPTVRGHQGKRIPSWVSKHPVSCSILKRINDNYRYPEDPFGALADFNIISEKARKRTVRELLRRTPGSLGAKPWTASTASRACRNRHLGTLMRCCV